MSVIRHISVFVGLAAAVWIAMSTHPKQVVAQERVYYYDYMRQELDWHTFESEHFLIHFHADSTGRGSDRTAQVVARVAEDVYGPITALYEHEPDSKVSIVLKDFEDYSNGAAYFFDNKIEIWAPSLASPLRGEHDWLRNVIAHEFTHIVQVQKAMKGSRKWPFYYFQWLAYEDVRRPDVLYGYPDVIVSYPFPVLNNPAWFAEGTAQYQRADLHYDTWDTHRDMLLRSRFLSDNDFSLSGMGDLQAKTSIEREQVYNQGFAFTTHLANRFGEESLREISDQLGDWLRWTIEGAISDATGQSGDRVFDLWADSVRAGYGEAVRDIRATEVSGATVEEGGSFNFSPRFSPDGTRIAYVSSKGSDYSSTSLYVVDRKSGLEKAFEIKGLIYSDDQANHECALSTPLVPAVTGEISWSPDSRKIVFAKTGDTDLGYLYADLYEVDVESEEITRLTNQARATSPAYSPDGESLIFIGQSDGTTNLYVIPAEPDAEPVRLTSFDDGTQVYSPRWHPDGQGVYFATGSGPHVEAARDIFMATRDGVGLVPVIATEADERDPSLSPDGRWLYFASDRTGIFNINRVPLEFASGPFDPGQFEQLTNVVGGAFHPDVSGDGSLAFSRFGGDGYDIALLRSPEPVQPVAYRPPGILQKKPADHEPQFAALNAFDDTDLSGWPAGALTNPDTSRTDSASGSNSSATLPEPYGDTFTSFQFFPVLRLDWYANAERAQIDNPGGRAFQGGEFLRNTKLGLYMVSREVLDGLSFSAGFMLGLWSKPWDSFGDFISPGRLDKLERDVFFRFDYRKGLPFIKKRWAPQISVEFFNVVRNVENGLDIEEYPCTACYPDTTYADISYSLWEVDVYSRSKLNRSMLLEFAYRYSPYRARTETFFSEEAGISIPSSSTRYFIGHAIGSKLYVDALKSHLNADILPLGIRAELGYEYQPSRLLDNFSVEDGVLVPEYLSYKNHQLLADLRLGWKLPFGNRRAPHGLGVRVRGTTILGGEVDSFFNDYIGGLSGARGYPFYALGGNETVWAQLSYQFPIFSHIGRQFAFLHLNKLYGRIFADAAAAWTIDVPGVDEIRTDLGAELRLGISSFYLLPTAAFVSATYGFNEFLVRLDDGFVTPDGSQFVQYGHQVLWHFGVLFEFDL